MTVGDLVRVKDGSGYYEEGEDTTCLWPQAKGQIAMVLDLRKLTSYYSHHTYRTAVTVEILGEVSEFAASGLEVINESR